MAEDLQNYKLQLQQVEAALTTSPEDEELLKLKKDLEEVIALTAELIKSTLPDDVHKSDIELLTADLDVVDPASISSEKVKKDWKVGDRCSAFLLEDGQYYDATVESIDHNEVSVLFDDHKIGIPVVLTQDFLKELPKGHDRGASKARKQPSTKEREYQKKKKLKKQMRFKQLEEEREVEKNKWLMFSSKTYKKGVTKKSIFASPDNANGRVGIGTCGVAGRGMTDYMQAEKHKK